MTTEFTIRLLVRVAISAWYIYDDIRNARWLPSWRRYSVIPFELAWVGRYAVTGVADDALDWALTTITVVLSVWNGWSARRNKRDGNDFQAKEVAAQQLTEVQTRSYRQQVAEARA